MTSSEKLVTLMTQLDRPEVSEIVELLTDKVGAVDNMGDGNKFIYFNDGSVAGFRHKDNAVWSQIDHQN